MTWLLPTETAVVWRGDAVLQTSWGDVGGGWSVLVEAMYSHAQQESVLVWRVDDAPVYLTEDTYRLCRAPVCRVQAHFERIARYVAGLGRGPAPSARVRQ